MSLSIVIVYLYYLVDIENIIINPILNKACNIFYSQSKRRFLVRVQYNFLRFTGKDLLLKKKTRKLYEKNIHCIMEYCHGVLTGVLPAECRRERVDIPANSP